MMRHPCLLQVFPRERVIMTRERAKGSYFTGSYLSAKLVAELPIGAAFPLLFGLITYPMCGLNPRPSRLLKVVCQYREGLAPAAFAVGGGCEVLHTFSMRPHPALHTRSSWASSPWSRSRLAQWALPLARWRRQLRLHPR